MQGDPSRNTLSLKEVLERLKCGEEISKEVLIESIKGHCEENATLQNDNATLQKEKASLQEEIAKINEQLQKSDAIIVKLEAQHNVDRGMIDSHQREFQRVSQERDDLNSQLKEKDEIMVKQQSQLKEKDEIMVKQQSQLKEKDEMLANQQRVNTERMMMFEADMLAKHARDIQATREAMRDKAFNEVMDFAIAYVDAHVKVNKHKRERLHRYILSKGAYKISDNLRTTYADIFVDLLKIIDALLLEDDNIEETPEEDFPNDE